jgi:hypothetical protein
MGRVCRAIVTCCLLSALSAACAAHHPTHVAPDESQPHITWEIRSGGDLGDEILMCGSPEPSRQCVLSASAERNGRPVTVHLYLHAAARQTSYLGVMHVPFLQGDEGHKGYDVSATVAPGSQPVGSTVSGLVTSKAGEYTFRVSLDTRQTGLATSPPIQQQVSVLVK